LPKPRKWVIIVLIYTLYALVRKKQIKLLENSKKTTNFASLETHKNPHPSLLFKFNGVHTVTLDEDFVFLRLQKSHIVSLSTTLPISHAATL
jgi:hypothetical protein